MRTYPAVKMTCLNKETADGVMDILKEWGIRSTLEVDEDNKLYIVAYDVTDKELVDLRGLIVLKNITGLTVVGIHKGRRLIQEIADTVVVPAIKDAVSASFSAKDWLDKTYDNIKKNPYEDGNWEPLKHKTASTISFIKSKFSKKG